MERWKEKRERAVKGKCDIGSLARVMRGRNIYTEVRKELRNSILLPTLTYRSETWTWNRAEQSACSGQKLSKRIIWHDKMRG